MPKWHSPPTVAGLVELPKVFFNLHEDCAVSCSTFFQNVYYWRRYWMALHNINDIAKYYQKY